MRAADFDALIALLAPDVALHADKQTIPSAAPITIDGAAAVARAAMAAAGRALFTGVLLVDGGVGLAMAPHGRLRLVLAFATGDDAIGRIDIIADPQRLSRLELAVL